MSFPLTVLKRSLLAVVLAGSTLVSAWGQATNSPIVFAPGAITTTFVDPPVVGRSENSSGGEHAQWLRVEFHYSVAPKGPVPFVDAVEFRIWIEGRDLYASDATAEGIPVGLTGTVTYINLPENKDGYGVFFVHPSTLARYSTKAGSSDFDRKFNVHIEAYVGGAKMDYFDKTKEQDPNWFSQLRTVPGLVYRQDQSPFLLTDTVRYPQIKLPTPAQ